MKGIPRRRWKRCARRAVARFPRELARLHVPGLWAGGDGFMQWFFGRPVRRQSPAPSLKVEQFEARCVPSFLGGVSVDAGAGPRAVAVADLNNDGVADLVVANNGNGTVSVLLGNGDGSFKPARPFTAGVQPDAVAVGDFNGDGIPDLVVANAGSNDVTIL